MPGYRIDHGLLPVAVHSEYRSLLATVWLQMTNYCKDLQRVKSVTISEVRKLAELP